MDTLNVASNTAREQILESFLAKAFSDGCPFAVWKKPGQPMVEMIMDTHPNPYTSPNVDLDDLPEGFMIYPFLTSDKHQPVFIKASRYERFLLGAVSTSEQDTGFAYENIPEGSTTTVRKKLPLSR